MTNRNTQRLAIGIFTILVVFGSSSVGVFLLARDLYTDYTIRHLIEPAYNFRRPAGGRLSDTPYSPVGGLAPSQSELGRAQILLLSQTSSYSRLKLQGMLYLATGEWQSFVDLFSKMPTEVRREPAMINNLGVSYLALSE